MQENERIEEILKSLSKENDNSSEEIEFVFGSDPIEEARNDSSKVNLNFVAEFEEDTVSEIVVPDKFEPNEKFNTPLSKSEEPSRVKVTYMPKFTGASDNYRISPHKGKIILGGIIKRT